jgi:hypothetical protein
METSPVFRGNLAERQLPEVLNHLARSAETGTLFLQHHSVCKSLYLENGKVIFAASNDPDDRLGPLLLRRRKVTAKQLEELGTRVSPGKRLGTVLVLQGILQPNDLYHCVLEQITEIAFSVFDWNEGSFEFVREPLPQKEVILLNITMPDLILMGMMRITRWSTIHRALPSMDAVYRKKDGWSPIVRTMNLPGEAENLMELFDRPRTLNEVLAISRMGDFDTCRTVWAFLVLGIIEEILVAPRWSDTDDPIDRVEPPQTRTQELPTQEMPAPVDPQQSEDTSKITISESLDPQTAEPPVQQSNEQATEDIAEQTTALTKEDLETILDEQSPFAELSFSDFAEFTDMNEGEPEPASQPASSSEGSWETQVLPRLRDFNEVHRYLFEMVSLELGAGAHSFVGRVFRRASTKYPMVFESVGINDFGDLDEGPLLANIQSNLVQNYLEALDYLITEERAMISLFLEMRRAEAIEAGLKRILNRRERRVR